MKTKCNLIQLCLLIVLTLALIPIVKAADETAHAPGVPAQPVSQTNAPIPWNQIGAKAGAEYHGEGLAVKPATDGARLHCVFQRLDGEATREGLWLVSTVTNTAADRFQVRAAAIGRTEEKVAMELSSVGNVVVDGQSVSFVRLGLTEEYSVSMDGVRQDFLVQEKPAGAGELRVRLAVDGAKVAQTTYGAQLILNQSKRKIAYNRLRVTDATGKELSARMEAGTELAVVVNDAGAVYPVRIDPTFSDANWVVLNPGIPGLNGQVIAIAADSAGNVYAGGTFTIAGGVITICIAKWNGSAWSALGSGLDGAVAVYALTVDRSGNVYAGGTFTTADGMVANGIAKWNGTNWSALGSGFTNGVVNALAVDRSGNVYAGGNFTAAGGVAANNIAEWNGTNWLALGSGFSISDYNDEAYVLALAVDSAGNVYAGGDFDTAGGVVANGIAKWNGSAWLALGADGNSYVNALAVDSAGNVYAGGEIGAPGEANAYYIAEWNGSAWAALGSGTSGGDNDVEALAVDSAGNVYAGGYFTMAGGVAVNHIAKWNGSAWSALGSGISSGIQNYVGALAVDSAGKVYAGGNFATAGETNAYGIAKWNGSAWSALGFSSVMNNYVYALTVDRAGNVYAGGNFTTAGGVAANYIAKWNGSAWSTLGSGLNFQVNALTVDKAGNVYTGGGFTTAGGVAANSIAKWNGNAWSALGSGFTNGVVYALAADSAGNVYAGGNFTTAGGVAANNIAEWNGSAWSALGSPGFNNGVSALALDNAGNVYAGGGNFVAEWNGSAWSVLGSGLYLYNSGGGVYALAVDSAGNVYAGGNFTTAGGVPAYCIAEWNGSMWSALGSGLLYQGSGGVYALAVDSADNVYAGGNITTAGGVAVNNIAEWNGTNWLALGMGLNGQVNALAVNSAGHVYVGGDFFTAGTNVSPFIAEAMTFLSLTVATTSLPNGTNHLVYNQTLNANGGLPPYSWTNSAGLLPPGLSLSPSGVISGIPTTNGTFNFTVQVTDASSAIATQALAITLMNVSPPVLTIISPTSGQRWSNAVFTVTGTVTDSVAVTSVFYSLNNGGWSNAVTANNWANWTAAVALIPGTNTIAAYTVDAIGNSSATNTVSMDYVISFKPVLAITNVPAGLNVSNAAFTVRGTASDNWQVANVFYSLNNAGWSNAVTGNNWTNWSATINLIPGTNTIKAYAVDTSGNISATNSVSLDYVANVLQVAIVGQGTLSPNYNNNTLVIGNSYKMTAKAAKGFKFKNWTISTNWLGGTVSTMAALQFTMGPNLTLQATFADATKPVLKIAKLNSKPTTNVVTVVGTATDNVAVTNVYYQLNGGSLTPATTGNQWANWSVAVTLVSGVNHFTAYAVDASGNLSTTAKLTLTYTAPNAAAVAKLTGLGTASHFTITDSALSNNGFKFKLHRATSENGRIEVSTDLVHWHTLTNFTGTNSIVNFLDQTATNSVQRFYRVVSP